MRLIDVPMLYAPEATISPDAYYYGPGHTRGPGPLNIGKGSRIDHGCILIGNVEIGEKTHIPPYCILYGKYGIKIGNNVNLGAYTVLHTESESFTGEFLMGPLVAEHERRPTRLPIVIEDYVTVATRCTVLPGVIIGLGSIVGAHSLVRCNIPQGEKWAGTPAKLIGQVARFGQEKTCLTA